MPPQPHKQTPPAAAIRGLSLLLGLVALWGCGDVFSAHPTTVAHVDGTELTVDRLADVLILAQPLPLERDVAMSLARHWVYVTAFALHLAERGAPADTAAALETMWFPVRRVLISRLDVGRGLEGIQPDTATVDSAYGAGNLRMLFHILRVAPREAPVEVRRAQRDTAQLILQSLVDGGSWRAANAYNQDSAARALGGSVGPVRRGQVLPRFENAGFALDAGQLSPVTETDVGYHIIYRPRLNEVRDAYSLYVANELAARADSVYAQQLLEEKRLVMADEAADRVRDVARDPWGSMESGTVVAAYQGGEITAADIAQYLPYVSPQDQQRLPGATQRDILALVRQVAVQEVLWGKVDSAGLEMSDSVRTALYDQYRGVVTAAASAMQLSLDSLYATDVAPAVRRQRAARMVDRYFDAIAARRVEQAALPAFLITEALQGRGWEIRPRAIEHVLRLAERLLAATGGSS